MVLWWQLNCRPCSGPQRSWWRYRSLDDARPLHLYLGCRDVNEPAFAIGFDLLAGRHILPLAVVFSQSRTPGGRAGICRRTRAAKAHRYITGSSEAAEPIPIQTLQGSEPSVSFAIVRRARDVQASDIFSSPTRSVFLSPRDKSAGSIRKIFAGSPVTSHRRNENAAGGSGVTPTTDV